MVNDIISKLSPKQIQEVFIQILEFYTKPSFGSVKQREFDIFLFIKLQEIGFFEKNDDIYEIMSKLKITRSKARNLIYESNLRKLNSNELDQKLKEVLKNIHFLKSNSYLISIEIENPLLIDHLKAKLKNKGYSSDGSFSPELVRLNTEAFVAILEDYIDENSKKSIKTKLVEMGYEKDTSFKGILGAYFKDIAQKVFGDNAGELVAEKYITPILDGAVEIIN